MAILHEFSDQLPLNYDRINENFQALVAAVNALARDEVLQFGEAGANQGEYARLSGANFIGQVTCPSLLVGPPGGTQRNVVTTHDFAEEARGGVVKRAGEVLDLTQSISATPTQAEVEAIQAKVNELLTALKNAAHMTSSA